MKNSFIALLFFLSRAICFSQISIVVNDIADGGQSFIVSTANPVGTYDLETTGAGVTWDFSDLTSIAQDTIDWLDATDTNPAYFLLWFSSNVAENFTNGISSDTFSIDDIYNFYDRGSDKLEQTGIAGTVSGIPLPASFSDPDVVYDFPLDYENEYSSVSDYSFDLLGIASFSETRDRSTVIDGWGTITTPLSTFEVIRLKSTILINDVLDYSGTEIPISYTNHEYKWLAKEMGIPVLQINTSDIGGFEAVTAVTYQDTAIIIDGIAGNFYTEPMYSVFPNPVRDELNISGYANISEAYRFEIFDNNANLKYASQKQTKPKGNFIISKEAHEFALSTGIYILKLYAGVELVAVKKFIFLP